MKLDKIVTWYQKKISTYDKQQWEKTVEQRILNGFVHVPLKNTELKTELIDVDLVRGSSFSKAKPKQSLLTVLKLSVLRFLFLPIYAKWWVEQTSPKIFTALLFLYLMQMLNWGVYSYNIHRHDYDDGEHIISLIEFIIPMTLSLVLSTIHSQIVATASITNDSANKRNPFLQSKKRKRERIRRKRKHNKVRPANETKIPLSCDPVNGQTDNISMGSVYLRRPSQMISALSVGAASGAVAAIGLLARRTSSTTTTVHNNDKTNNKYLNEPVILSNKVSLDLEEEEHPTETDQVLHMHENTITDDPTIKSPTGLRKRNVNFNSNLEMTIGKNVRPSTQPDEAVNRIDVRDEPMPMPIEAINGCDDDGFESFNGKSSSGEDNVAQRRSDLNACCDNIVAISNNNIQRNANDRKDKNSDTDTAKKGLQLASTSKLRDDSLDSRSKISSKNSSRIVDSTDTDEEGEACESLPSPNLSINSHFTEGTTSATEWIGITTNSEDASYNSSELEHSDSQGEYSENGADYDITPTVILNPCCGNGDRISCTIWERRQTKKAEMSVLDISTAIIERVEAMPEPCDYIFIGAGLSIILSFIPTFCRLCDATVNLTNSTDINILDMPVILLENSSFSCIAILKLAFGTATWEQLVLGVSFVVRICLTFVLFFLLAVAERTFKQRFLYAKLFSHLTSSRRARKSKVPHFRLNKVRNIKIWLSVRSYLKRRGPQRSVDVIVSAAYILTLLFLAFLSVEFLKDSVHLQSQYNLEALIWSCCLGCFLLRFMTLGTKINRKYRSISVLITEQINLYLQIEQKPHKKEELMVANSVLKLAADLLKELESPFKISGLSANPYLYTTIKVVILSALSGVLSEMLGFKLKLHKIKIK